MTSGTYNNCGTTSPRKFPLSAVFDVIENEDFFQTYKVDYHGGERYPHLERITGKPDVLGDIAKMKAPPVAAAKD